MTILLERKFGKLLLEERESERDGMQGTREGHIYMLKTDHTSSIK
jgi:hypothetical protein